MRALAFLGAAVVAGTFFAAGTRIARADQVAVFGGGQAAFSDYVFFGATAALPGSTLGDGLALRGLVETGGYDYISGNLGTVKANFGGGELDAVYQLTHKSFWSDFGLGVNDTYTGLVPYDPGNPLRGEQAELRISLDGGKIAGPWRADWLGYYGTRLQDYQWLLGVTHALSPNWRLGAQVYADGNPTYNEHQLGAYAGLAFAKGSELQISAGEAWQSGFTPRAYLRALLYERL